MSSKYKRLMFKKSTNALLVNNHIFQKVREFLHHLAHFLKILITDFESNIVTYILNEINSNQDGGQKAPPPPLPTSFSPVTSTNVGIRPQIFLTFSFNPFDRLM